MAWQDILGKLGELMGGGQDENKPAIPQHTDPSALADQMRRMKNYQPQGDEAMAAAQQAELQRQGQAMLGGAGMGGARNMSRMYNHGLDETGGDDAKKAEAFARIRAMMTGGQ